MALHKRITRIARLTATEGTVTDHPAFGVGPTCAWTGINAMLILASTTGSTVIIGGALGSTRWWYAIIIL